MRYVDREIRSSSRASSHGIESVGLRCTVSTNAAANTDRVYVTIDDDPQPKERRIVDWKPRLSDSGTLSRAYPQRGMKGVLIPTDVGRPWLLW